MDIQSIAAVAGFFVGVAYVIGGLIVNIHMSKYGLTEYGVLRIKYLVVGLVYFIHFFVLTVEDIIVVVATIVVVPLTLLNPTLIFIFYFLLLLVIFLLSLKFIRTVDKIDPFYRLTILSQLSSGFSIAVAIRWILTNSSDATLSLLIIAAIAVGIFSFIIQIYFYASNIYANPASVVASFDVIGIDIPLPVQLAFDTNAVWLKDMGLPISRTNITDQVLLIDETDNHYIIGIEQEPKMRVVKIVKEAIKGIVYLDVNAEKAPPASGHQTTRADHS